MDNINLEHDEDIKTLNIDISNVDSNDTLSFTKENDAEPISIDSIKFDTINNTDAKPPNLSSFDKKDIQFGLDLLENPNKKKKNSDEGITFSPSKNIENVNEFKINTTEKTEPESINSLNINNISDTNNLNLDKKEDDINIVKIDGDINIDDIFKDVNKQDELFKNVNKPDDINKPEESIDTLKLNIDDTRKEDIIHNVPVESFIPRKKTPEEILSEKKDYLSKFDRLIEKGYNIPRRFTLASDLDEMEYEYNKIKNSKELDNSVKFQRQMLMACITGVEWVNGKFDPFDIKLDGWSESVNENINDYDEVFEELHEKYKDKASVPPEIKLLFMLGGSAFMFHLSKTLFKTSLPGMEQIMQQNPELMKQFASAAMNSMSNQNPGFANLMGSMGGIPNQGMMNQNQGMMHQSTEEQYKNQTNSFNSRKEMSGPSGVDDILNKIAKQEVREAQTLGDADNNTDGIRGSDFPKVNKGISINI